MSAAAQGGWRPTASIDVLRARARLLQRLRTFFDGRGLMEVETPLLSRAAATDPSQASLATRWHGDSGDQGQCRYLHGSPELAMKRLLVAGSGPIYQVCKVFRDGERGRWHHPEFSLLEWYRPGWGLGELIAEVGELVRVLLDRPDLESEVVRYRDLFQRRLGIDPWTAAPSSLAATAARQGLTGLEGLALDADGWLDLLMTHCLQQDLGQGRMTFVRDFPPSQAALSRVNLGPPMSAARFELFLEGVELANGFDELTDPDEQRARFAADLKARETQGLPHPPMDEAFIAALGVGMPATSGVALGLDRLLMLATGAATIDEVLSFTIERA